MNNQPINPPTPEQVATAAYLIWENEGRPHGRHVAHWLQAEEQLMADALHDGGALLRLDPARLTHPVAAAAPPSARRGRAKGREVVTR